MLLIFGFYFFSFVSFSTLLQITFQMVDFELDYWGVFRFSFQSSVFS